MDLDKYEWFVEDSVMFSGRDRLIENSLGLAGESGEVVDKIKKYLNDPNYDSEGIIRELGDVLFYVVALSHFFGFSLAQVMQINKNKLEDRANRGVLLGSGDNR